MQLLKTPVSSKTIPNATWENAQKLLKKIGHGTFVSFNMKQKSWNTVLTSIASIWLCAAAAGAA